MMMPTCKACVGLATAGKRPPKSNSEIISNAIILMLMITIIIMVGGGIKSLQPRAPGTDA